MSKKDFPSEKDLDQTEATTAKSEKETKSEAKKQAVKADKKEKTPEQKLQEELAKAQAASKDFEDKYLRSQAEMQNMQNRYNKERAQLIKYESQSLAKDVLPAMDNLERALGTKVDDEASQQLKKGVQMTLDSLVKAMKDHGISEIEAEGVKFDPTLHQAVQTVAASSDDQKDHVVQVLQKGYQYKDRTLRPAMVVVAQ
ncbi:nucleotide exchange factor GrpE [Lactobacillus sp. ESL0731]|uniref:nucleotide exchange factor GrpE n=1 Tax=unclassified Lactobacillus TaxID=2620435 RepID=UPI0023F66AA1|nr:MULTISPECIES: nucleotide exchange factor GrpE [unclassified Lactobacillus]WEV50421.1 nucleotide exchange factor GrpE [Lactobacillus sp. ESL0700]WEV61551.1 nucleotide exchange factor GrpE [Lactobacillus sp. ESL0731]